MSKKLTPSCLVIFIDNMHGLPLEYRLMLLLCLILSGVLGEYFSSVSHLLLICFSFHFLTLGMCAVRRLCAVIKDQI